MFTTPEFCTPDEKAGVAFEYQAVGLLSPILARRFGLLFRSECQDEVLD
jgi:hypothetical protein